MNDANPSEAAPPEPAELLTGLEAIERTERALCDDAVTRHPATAEGLALAGCRAASVSRTQAPVPAEGAQPLLRSCVHHVVGGYAPWESGRAAFELADSDAQAAVDHALVAHLLSGRIGRPGTCTLARGAAERLSSVRLPEGLAGEIEEDEAGSVVDLARVAFRLVSERTGRLRDVAVRSGPRGAPNVLIAAGRAASVAQQAAEMLTGSGTHTAVVDVALIHPVPEERLKADLLGAETVVVVQDPTHPDWLEALHAILPEGASGARVRVDHDASVQQLLEALAEHIGGEAEAPPEQGEPTELVVLSDRGWARGLASQLALHSMPPGLGGLLHVVPWGLGFELTGLELPSRRILVAARADGASIGATLLRSRPEAVFVVADGNDGELLSTLGDRCRAALAEARVRLFALRDVAPDGLVDAIVAGLEDGAGELAAELVRTPLPPPEVHFRADESTLPLLPFAESLPERSPEAVRAFHRGGPTFGAPDPSVRVAAIEPLVAAMRARVDEGEALEVLAPSDVLSLYLEAQASARSPARARFEALAVALREGVNDLLLLERMHSDEGRDPGAVAASLGAHGGLFNAAALAAVVGTKRGSAPLPESRRVRLEAVRDQLDGWLKADPTPITRVIGAPGADLDGSLVPDGVTEHPEPMAAAVGLFDGLVRRMLPVVRAARIAALELDDSYDSALHDEVLARLDWDGFSEDELALLPAVTAAVPGSGVRAGGEADLSALLRSGRPVGVLVLDEANADDDRLDAASVHESVGWLAAAHREGLVVQTALTRPAHAKEGLFQLARATRPWAAVITTQREAEGDLAAIRAEADLAGRGAPLLVYAPDAGETWAERLSLEGNTQVDQRWPVFPFACRDQGGEEQSLELRFTHAHALALQPAFADHFQVITHDDWAQDQVPVAEYVAGLVPGEAQKAIPFVWVIDGNGTLGRAVTTVDVALACRDRMRGWRLLQELAGYDNLHAIRAAEEARKDALEGAEQAADELDKAHAVALEQARAETARESMERLAAALMDLDGPLAAAPAAPRPAPVAPPPNGAGAPVEDAPPAEEPPPPPEPTLSIGGDPWIDTPMCTSCNECTNLNPRMFQYDGDKQAFLANAEAGTFAELVRAAELCPADCIHPGTPRPDDATATPELIQLAADIA